MVYDTQRQDKRSADMGGNIRIMILVHLDFCQSFDPPPPPSAAAHHDASLLSGLLFLCPQCQNLRKNQRALQQRECGRTHDPAAERRPFSSRTQHQKMKPHNRRSNV
jgi:hypothetical protein